MTYEMHLQSNTSSIKTSEPSVKSETSTPPMPGRKVVLKEGDHLPDHLLKLLEDWHHNNGNQQPPGSYRSNGGNMKRKVKTFSRNHKPMFEEIVLVYSPIRYSMLVLREQQDQRQLDKFVACLSHGGFKVFLRQWLGGDKYDDHMCAVRLTAKSNGQYERPDAEFWMMMDKKQPVRNVGLGKEPGSQKRRRESSASFTSHEDSMSTRRSSDVTRHREETSIPSSVLDNQQEMGPVSNRNELLILSKDKPETTIEFKLVVSRTSTTRYLPIESEETGEKLFKTITEFFRRYDRLIGNQVLECIIVGEIECRCIYNAKELDYLLRSLRSRVGDVKVEVRQGT